MLDIKQIGQAVNIIAAEKNIQKEKLVEIIEAAIKTAYKKDYGTRDEEVNVKLNLEAGEVEISLEKTLVKEVTNPSLEISFEELGDDAEGFSEGDTIELDVTDEVMNEENAESFGRIASQAARQVIIQKIGDTEKEKIYDLFQGKEGEVIGMKIEMVESGKVIFDYNGNQVVLPKSEQVTRDNYVAGARMFIYVAEVSKAENTAPKVILSRKRAEAVAGIFEEFVPEIGEGIISISNIVRQAGVKTKMLVASTYDEIDPVGTLIGQKGMRVKSVMEEIGGEKIDIIADSGDMAEIIKKSLSPAEVIKVDINEEEGLAIAYIKPEERAKAVGKNGVNVNLASNLVGYKISIEDIEA
ncbi:MAG: transcription termination factor NusA [Candidatus Gracilibacteria bacterium]|nr:transcription termination factor NusA [Candidatus Gracilibacteria bacterium]